jgi:carboxyl-terminal processing protease
VSSELLEGGIGLISVKNFEAKCAAQAEAAIEDLTARGAKGLIFDLRGNPGGQLDELLEILDYILPEGVIFIRKSIDGAVEEERSDAGCVKMPMAGAGKRRHLQRRGFFAAAWANTAGPLPWERRPPEKATPRSLCA